MTEGGDEEAADALLEDARPARRARRAGPGSGASRCGLAVRELGLAAHGKPRPPPQPDHHQPGRQGNTAFGAYDPDVVQLFEAFRLPPDRDACEWEPW
jgi:hypothetical protein